MILGHLGVCTRGRPLSEPLFCLSHSYVVTPGGPQPPTYPEQRHLLRNLCLVSRQLRQLVEPILYQEFMPGYGDRWCYTRYTWDRRLTVFMRTVARRRDLAAHVRRIYIHPHLITDLGIGEPKKKWVAGVSQPPGPITRQEAQDTLQEVAQALGDDALRTLSADDVLAGLIAELPNLEHLSLHIELPVRSMLGSAGLRAARVSQLPIKTVDFCSGASESQVQAAMLLHLDEYANDLWAACPSLETLNLHMCESLWSRPTPFPPLPQLTTLRLTYTELGKSDLEKILSACQKLRHFHYESARGSFYPDKRAKAVQLGDMVTLLECQRATLESVHLDWRQKVVFEGDPKLGPLISFRAFPVLHHLFLNADEIHNQLEGRNSTDDPELWAQILPSNIKSLHLASTVIHKRHPREELLVQGLADAVSCGQCPSLTEVRWGGQVEKRGE